MGYFPIKGVIPPVITPFTADGRVDFAAFEENILQWNETGLAGYLILGSNGETPYIERSDKLRLVQIARAAAKPGMLILAGTGMESTSATISLSNEMADLGADGVLVLTPCFFKDQMDEETMVQYFTDVADNSRVPVLLYNATKFTGVNITAGAVSRLSAHPNIIGMKDSAGSIAQLMSFVTKGLDEQFNLITGSASAWYPAMAIGIRAGIMALANCCPRECVEEQRLFDEGHMDEAYALYRRLFPVNACVTGKLGVAALKYACTRLGYHGGTVCRPLLELTDEQKHSVDAVLEQAQLL